MRQMWPSNEEIFQRFIREMGIIAIAPSLRRKSSPFPSPPLSSQRLFRRLVNANARKNSPRFRFSEEFNSEFRNVINEACRASMREV